MAHHRAIANFRLNEWPKAQASYTMFYNKHMAVHEIIPSIDFLLDVLFSSRRALVRYPVFTLVNVSMPKMHLSYGTMRCPNKRLYSALNDIVLTFSFSPTQYDPRVKPRFLIRIAHGVYLWGNSISTSTDYLTISLPHSAFLSLEIGTLTSDVEFLYYVLGPLTKNFARHNRYYKNATFDNEPISAPIANSSIRNLTIPNLLHLKPYNLWIYNEEMWDRLPNILNVKSANDDFCDYYCRFLSKRFYGKYRTKNVKDIEQKVFDYLEVAVLDLLERLRNPSNPSSAEDARNGNTLIYMMTGQEHSIEEYVLSLSLDPIAVDKTIAKYSNINSAIVSLLKGGEQ